MSAFDALSFWREADFSGRMGWYREVSANRLPAKFRICASLPAGVALDAAEEDLWRALEAGTQSFLALRERLRAGGARLPQEKPRPSLLELVAELARRMLAHCNFCRWDCRVDRRRGGKLGACKLGSGTRVSTHFHHGGEELVYRGTHGSGTIFFTSCNMRCAFCQNGDISTDRLNGEEVSARTPATMATTSTGWAAIRRFTCTPSSRRSRSCPLARAPRREEILAAFRRARERGLRFESLSCERFSRPLSGVGSMVTRNFDSTICEVSRHSVTEVALSLIHRSCQPANSRQSSPASALRIAASSFFGS